MIDVSALIEELMLASLPVVGVSSDGRIDYSRELTAAELTTAQAVIAAHDPAKRERDERAAQDGARQALTTLRTYLDTISPTGAQTVVALKACIRVVLWLVRNELKG